MYLHVCSLYLVIRRHGNTSGFLCIVVSNIYGQLQVPTAAMKTLPLCFIPVSHSLPASAFPNNTLLMAGFIISPFMFLACISSML